MVLKQYLIVVLCFILISCSNKIVQTESGLMYRILMKSSNSMKAKEGDVVYIYETTSYRNGKIIYSNFNSTTPVKILIGGNQATAAVDEGLRGMRIGEVRELIAPPFLVIRRSYPPNVSPDSTLIIKIKLDRIERK